MSSGAWGDVDVDVLVSGYASIDVVYQADGSPRVGATALLRGPVISPPRCGGCGPGAAAALARAGCRVGLVTWLGDDREGKACLRAWDDAGIEHGGVVVASGQMSPRSLLFYDPDGGATCYYHPSGSAVLRLNAVGREMLARARVLAVTVGPSALTQELIDARRPDQPLVWNVKADGDAFPLGLRLRLTREAAVICLNRGELPFVASTLPFVASVLPGELGQGADAALTAAIQRHSGGVVIVTAGAAGCRIAWPGGASHVPALPVDVVDPTGAGDAFFGAFVAGWLRGEDLVEAAAVATEHVAAFLGQRAAGEGDA